MKEAKFWNLEGDRVRCYLCPHHCSIADNRRGICGVREQRSRVLYSMNYGKVSSANIDPVEKKPLFHFLPGEKVFSIGSVGCNFRCLHCQNFTISQASLAELSLRDMRPEEVSEIGLSQGCQGVAYTYNEPTIWHEFAYDASKIAKEKGLSTIYVTNGFIEEEPLRELSSCLDAMNIDVKGFTDHFYGKVCKAPLEPVLRAVELAYKLGIHIELTYLIIPGKNDTEDEMKRFVEWVANSVDVKVPVHFSRFHPDYMMTDVPQTPIKTMELARKLGIDGGLKFIYLGNVSIPHSEDTVCPKCGKVVIARTGFRVTKMDAVDGKCSNCGEDLYLVQ